MLLVRKLHKWFGLVIGLQLLLWCVSGLVFAWLDHDEVNAEHSVQPAARTAFSPSAHFAEPMDWLARDVEIYDVQLVFVFDEWVWRVESSQGVELRRLEDAAVLELDQARIERFAVSRYSGDGQIESVAYLSSGNLESRETGAVWQVNFDDRSSTTFYISAADGKLLAARNSSWRIFDFFWMLHTMDYEGRDNFNNPLVITVGSAALWLSLSGFLLLFRSFRARDFVL